MIKGITPSKYTLETVKLNVIGTQEESNFGKRVQLWDGKRIDGGRIRKFTDVDIYEAEIKFYMKKAREYKEKGQIVGHTGLLLRKAKENLKAAKFQEAIKQNNQIKQTR